MRLNHILYDLFNEKEALYKTFSWQQLTAKNRSEFFKQNVVLTDDFKDLIYFIFKIKSYEFILVDKDYDTLKNKIESFERYSDWMSIPQVIPYYFIVRS